MKIPGPFTAEQEQYLKELRTQNRAQLRSLFGKLNPPDIRTFVGEYDAELLNQGGRTAQKITQFIFGLRGPWTGKAFKPTDATRGVGYNCFLYGEDFVEKLPMHTRIDDSQLDSGKSMFIDYRDLNHGIIRWLVGELREVTPTVILGIGAFGPKWGSRDGWRRKIPFVMIGPRRPYSISLTKVWVSQPDKARSAA